MTSITTHAGPADNPLGGLRARIGSAIQSALEPPVRRIPARRLRGAGILNVILGIGIAAVVAGGVVAIYTGAQTNVRTSAVRNTIELAASEIRRAYASAPNYDATMTPLLVSLLPADAIRGTGAARQVVTPWGGRITAGGGDTPSATGTGAVSNDRFFVSILGLPESTCEALASAFAERSDVVGLSIRGNDTNFQQVRTAAQIAAFDTVAEHLNACNGGDNDNLAIVFRG